jgi:hypothetical protein
MSESVFYRPLTVQIRTVAGIRESLEDMRLPFRADYTLDGGDIPPANLEQAARLILAGDDHAKALRGIMVWFRLTMQVGFLIEFETYRHGVECLSTSSAMHNELRHLSGPALAEQKQRDLPEKVYVRGLVAGYQALRHIYCARRTHRHPDWRIFCQALESLPYFEYLIYPEGRAHV